MRNHGECPYAFAGPRVDRLDIADRIGPLNTIRYLAADDYERAAKLAPRGSLLAKLTQGRLDRLKSP